MTQRLTQWYPADVKPVRKGVYEVRWGWSCANGGGYCHWNGRTWGNTFFEIGKAHKRGPASEAVQDKDWRGLASNPEKA